MSKIIVNRAEDLRIDGYTPKELCEGIEVGLGYKPGALRLQEILIAYMNLHSIAHAMLRLPNGRLAFRSHRKSIKIQNVNTSKMESADLITNMSRWTFCEMLEIYLKHAVVDEIDEEELLAWYRAYKMWEGLQPTLSFILNTKTYGLSCAMEYCERATKTPKQVPLKLLLLSTDVRDEFKPFADKMVNDLTNLLGGLTKNLFLPSERDNRRRLSSEHNLEKEAELGLLLSKDLDKKSKLKPKERYEAVLNGSWDYALNSIKMDFHDLIRKQDRRLPKGGLQSLDEEVENRDGRKLSRLDLLEREQESLQTLPQKETPADTDRYDELVAEIREAHGNTVGKVAKVYLEISLQQEKSKKVKQGEVAKALGMSRRTVYRAIKDIENFLRKKKEKS